MCFILCLFCIPRPETVFKLVGPPVEVLIDTIDVMHKVKDRCIEEFIPSHLHSGIIENQEIHHHSGFVISRIDGDCTIDDFAYGFNVFIHNS